MKHALIVSGAILILAGTAAPARAQNKTWTDRGFVSINVGFRPVETTFDDNITFTANAEQGDFDARYTTPAAPLLDISGGVRVWRSVGVGVGVSAYNKSSNAAITGRIPHPFFFDQRREVTGESSPVKREEMAVHVQALWMIRASTKIDIAVFGGPSYFMVKQPLVESLRYDESYPFDTATLTGANTSSQSQNKTGFNIGGDVSYMLNRRFGVGGGVRVSHTQVELSSQDGGVVRIDVGGAHVSAGVRMRF